MKKIALILAATFAAAAHAAILKSEVEQGLKRICIYADGSTKTISASGVCPMSN